LNKPQNTAKNKENNLLELSLLFLRLGCTAFGGPAVHIALMREEIVNKRKWIEEQHFLDLIGATNLIPGPNSTEMAIHIGQERAGIKGLLLAGLCFILPAVILTTLIAWICKDYGQLPQVKPLLLGIKPTIIAVILAAIYPLGKKAVKNTQTALFGISALILCLLGVSEVLVLFGFGFLALAISWISSPPVPPASSSAPGSSPSSTGSSSPPPFTANLLPLVGISNYNLLFTFLKIGAILYGSGYVLFAFLDSELVAKGLISRQQLLDAIAVGQFTPGPVFSAVSFIGYQINGLRGAAVSTLGIFLPAFVFVALLNPFVKKMRGSLHFTAFLDAVNVAAIALILVVCFNMGKEVLTDPKSIALGILALIISFSFKKLNSVWILLGSALFGYFM